MAQVLFLAETAVLTMYGGHGQGLALGAGVWRNVALDIDMALKLYDKITQHAHHTSCMFY